MENKDYMAEKDYKKYSGLVDKMSPHARRNLVLTCIFFIVLCALL